MINKCTVACALMGFLLGTLISLSNLSVLWIIAITTVSAAAAISIMVLYAEGYNE